MSGRADTSATPATGGASEAPERSLAQSGRLLRLARELALCADASTIAELVVRHVAGIAGGGPVAAYLLERDGAPGQAIARGFFAREPSGPPRVVRRALEEGRPVVADEAELRELRAYGADCGEALAGSMAAGGEAFGALLVGMPPAASVGVHPSLLATAAELAGASLANARRLAETHAEARRDPVTDLANHRAFQERLDQALRRAHRAGRELTLVFFDLDDFKRLNDTQGHPAGDRVLRELAHAVADVCRGGEELFRVGGDEFAVVVEGGTDAGVQLADRIRGATARQLVRLTISAGVASFPADAASKEELVAKADLALGAAKRAGKDTAIVFGDGRGGVAARSTLDVLYRELRERMGEGGFRDAALRELWEAARALARERTQEGMLETAATSLSTLLRATACVVSRLDGGRLLDAATYAPPPWRLDTATAFLVEDYPETAEVLATGEPRAVALSDEDVDESEAFVLRKLGMHSVLMLPLRVRGRPWGLVEVYDARERSFDGTDVALAELLIGHLEAQLAQLEHAEAVERLYRETLASLANAVERRSLEEGRHAQEVAELAGAVARRLAFPSELVRAAELAGLLHDVGKVAVPESVLGKPGPLTREERALVHVHAEAGERLLARVEPLEGVAAIVRSSHERWDGGGYPDGLRGEAIPVAARILAACDAFCALVEPRPHRSAISAEDALLELERHAGAQFDPAVVEALRQALATRGMDADAVELWRPDHLLGAAR